MAGFNGQFTVDNKNLLTLPAKQHDFLYLCSPDDLPGELTVNGLISLLKGLMKLSGEPAAQLKSVLKPGNGKSRLETLSSEEKIKLLVKVMELRTSGIYLLFDVANRCSLNYSEEFARKMKQFKSRNSLILYISGSGTCLLFNADHYFVYTYNETGYEWEEVKDSRSNVV